MRHRLDLVAGVDARGFILGSVLAYELNLGFVPVRKKGKLPYHTLAEEYTLEYGNATVEMHSDSVTPGQRVLLIDDLIATGADGKRDVQEKRVSVSINLEGGRIIKIKK